MTYTLNTNHTGESLYVEAKRFYDSDGPALPYWCDLKPVQKQPWENMANKMNMLAATARLSLDELARARVLTKQIKDYLSAPHVIKAFEELTGVLDAAGDH